MFPPTRIVCLTEETVETLYLLGEQERIVGISGYVVRPPRARREKPRVSAFTSANIDKILALRPDLVLTFSDLQADIAADLIRRGLDVHVCGGAARTRGGFLAFVDVDGFGRLAAARAAPDRLLHLFQGIEAQLILRRLAGPQTQSPANFAGLHSSARSKAASQRRRSMITPIERQTMKKVYLRLLPFCFLLYFICYLDRVNIGFAALQAWYFAQ